MVQIAGADSNGQIYPILVDSSGRPYVILHDPASVARGDTTIDYPDGLPVFGWRASNAAYLEIPSARYNDSTDNKGYQIVPVTPMTSERKEGVKITDGTETATITADGYQDVKSHTPEKCFASDYAAAQAAQVIITPTAGKKARIISTYVSTDDDGTDVTLAFGTSGNIFFKMYTARKSAQAGNEICALGAADETIKLTCGPKTFVSIGYDEVS